jgi:aspartate kinase
MSEIIVSKFGGSSMKDAVAMHRSANVAAGQNSSFILVSATYGTTNLLVELIQEAQAGHWGACEKILFNLRENHFEICSQITSDQMVSEKVRTYFNELETLARGVSLLRECSPKAMDQILSFGERVSSLLFSEAYKKDYPNRKVVLFDIRDVLITDNRFNKAKPQLDIIEKRAKREITFNENEVYISQGFIGSTEEGATTTLGRGGSDYSAALIAEAINADVLEIWTDVAGIASTDPRICESAQAIKEISFNEASEMAQYGAKILHPTTLVPAMRKNIPVFVGSSYDAQASGTWIKAEVEEKPLIRAITKRDNQVLLTIKTPKMLDAIGFMGRIFDVFTKYEISVDCVTTSEISVAVSVDKDLLGDKSFMQELSDIGEVSLENNYSLISLIGNKVLSTAGLGKTLFTSLENINVRMVCLGASAHNFNLLVNHSDCDMAINQLHQAFIGNKNENSVTRAW